MISYLMLDIIKDYIDKSRMIPYSEAQLRLRSVIDLDSSEAICAAGGLLQHLQSHRLVDELSRDYVSPVSSISTLRCLAN